MSSSDGLHFHLEVLAPHGLSGIEPFLSSCRLPLDAWESGFNGQVILRQSLDAPGDIEFQMDPSTLPTMNASGYIFRDPGEARALLQSLSNMLRAAGFSHWIAMDDANGDGFRVAHKCSSDWPPIWDGD